MALAPFCISDYGGPSATNILWFTVLSGFLFGTSIEHAVMSFLFLELLASLDLPDESR